MNIHIILKFKYSLILLLKNNYFQFTLIIIYTQFDTHYK